MSESHIAIFIFFLIMGVNVCASASDNTINKPEHKVLELINGYITGGFSCNDITGQEQKVLERIKMDFVSSNCKVYLCSKKESGFLSATRKSAVIISDDKGNIQHVGYFSDKIDI